MTKTYFAIALLACLTLISGKSFGDTDAATPGQKPLPKFVSPAEISKRTGNVDPSRAGGHAFIPSAPHPSGPAQKAVPASIGGPPGPKKNIAISGRANTAKNAAAIDGNDAKHRRD